MLFPICSQLGVRIEAFKGSIMGDGLTGCGRCRITPVSPVPSDPWAMPERSSEQSPQKPVKERASVLSAGGFSLASAFGVGVAQVRIRSSWPADIAAAMVPP